MYVADQTRPKGGYNREHCGHAPPSALSSRLLQFENFALGAHLLPKPGMVASHRVDTSPFRNAYDSAIR